MQHIRLKQVRLKNHPTLTEKWVQSVIDEDPTILGIGDVLVKDRERVHPGAGRLDLLLQDVDGHGRYEVEIQLGATDESHIIRTIEYWDIERRRYPQYDHTAVIVAEEVTSRFLNVISLFNGFIPIMALQMKAIETPEGIGLDFTRVLDTIQLGLLDEDEETTELTDRNYWETQRGTPKTVKLADRIFDMVRDFVPNIEQSYNKYYIGFWVDGRPCNFATCKPQKSAMQLRIRLPRTDDLDQAIEETGLNMLEYDKRWSQYRFKLQDGDISKHSEKLKELLQQAHDRRSNG